MLFDELLENVFIEFQLLQILQCKILLLFFNNSDQSRVAYFQKKLFRLFRHLNAQAVGLDSQVPSDLKSIFRGDLNFESAA